MRMNWRKCCDILKIGDPMKILYCLVGLFIVVVGCQRSADVTVSGGVYEEGTYAYTQGQTVADYVKMAGGYNDEALVDEALVLRVVPDSANQFRSVHLPASDSLGILPGDDIQVPVRTYRVRLDSVRMVTNLRLARDDQLVKVERGVLVPGVIEKGAVVAMVIGRGEGYALSDTTKAVTAFHYLYCHLHPKEYDRLLPFVGQAVDSLEALEDAHAVHQWLFAKQEYQTQGEAMLPPHGYFRVMQGMWLMPRTEINPGKGMRKRRFEDGRIWTTFMDGRQRWQYPDGRVVVKSSGGNEEVRYRDGRVAYTDLQGNVRTQYSDGREIWVLVSGTRSTFFPDGRVVRKSANGDVFRREKDGTTHQTYADGTVRIDYNDGRLFIKDILGNEETQYPDGHTVIITPTKDKVTLFPNGIQETKQADGTVVRFERDGRVEKRYASGRVTRVSAAGLRNDVFPDGTTVVQQQDGTRVVRYAQGDVLEARPDGYTLWKGRDGSVQETFSDGRRVGKLPSGASWEAFPDGRKIQVTAIGHRIETFPDGRREIALRGVYDYPTVLQRKLATVDDIPNAIKEKEKIHVAGTVVDSALHVNVMAFRVPYGDVIAGNVRRRDGRFESVLQLKEPGHYRVQVQVEMSGLRTYTAVHEAVTVGQLKPLAQLVLPITEYPGDELGAFALIDMANEARRHLGRKKLKTDRYLMQIAKARLREMIMKGEVSHLSKADEDVRNHMYKERVRFLAVGENVASSNFLETMHEGWMLSAGHRVNILSKRWSHMGVAVTDVGGMLWGVQVFAGW